MTPGTEIYSEGIYSIKYAEKLPVHGDIVSNGKPVNVSGLRGFKFVLYKNNEFYKSYSVATGSGEFPAVRTGEIIAIFKQFMI